MSRLRRVPSLRLGRLVGGRAMERASGFRSAENRAAYCRLYDEALAASTVSVEECDVETSYGLTHVLKAGSRAKPPLVALHAKSFSSTMWLPLLPVLADTHYVHLIDAVGDVNKSVATKALSSPARVASWLSEVTTALNISRSPIVAASIGTWMATHYAMENPTRVERLALICPAGIVSGQHPLWLFAALMKCGVRPTRERLSAFVDSMAMPSTAPRLRRDPWQPVVEQFVTGVSGFRTRINEAKPTRCSIDRLAAIDLPVLVVVGEAETLHDGPLMANRFRTKLPRARVELIADANHLVFIDRTERIAELLTEFLAQGTHEHDQREAQPT